MIQGGTVVSATGLGYQFWKSRWLNSSSQKRTCTVSPNPAVASTVTCSGAGCPARVICGYSTLSV